MSDENKVRLAHELLDEINARQDLTLEQTEVLRSFLPELPKQKTLEEITVHVYDAWIAASDDEFSGNEYDLDISLEDWLAELHTQLQGLKNNAEPAHPEYLEAEADYAAAPEGTIAACDGGNPCHKFHDKWLSISTFGIKDDKSMSRSCRRVLRWGWSK